MTLRATEQRNEFTIPSVERQLEDYLPDLQAMSGNKKVGVITANGPLLSSGPAMENCGLSPEDKANRVVVEGCEDDPEFAKAMACDGSYNAALFERDVLNGIKRLMNKDKDIAAILLECTELSPHAVAVQKLVKMPVWDYTSLTKWIQSGCVRRCKAELLEREGGALGLENSHHCLLRAGRRERGDAKCELAARSAHPQAPVLRTAPDADVHPCHDLEAGDEPGCHGDRW